MPRSIKVRQDSSQVAKTVEVKQLPLEQEGLNFKREAISSKQNMGDKRLSTWKEC
jgi:hypothetical protein